MELKPIIYDTFMKPFEKYGLQNRRKEMLSKVKGNTLEIGSGTGVNFNYYDSNKISQLSVLDLQFNNRIKEHIFNKKVKINYIEGNAEELPFPDNTFDSVVSTLIYCSVNDPNKALNEVYRVLKDGGRMYFMEHVLPEEKPYKQILNTLNSPWKAIAKCNVNRETLKTIKKANFEVTNLETFGKGGIIFIKGIGIKKK